MTQSDKFAVQSAWKLKSITYICVKMAREIVVLKTCTFISKHESEIDDLKFAYSTTLMEVYYKF